MEVFTMVKEREKRKLEQLREMEQIIIGYARVSSADDRQKLGYAVQKDALKDCDIVFSEKQSGDNDNRPELAKTIAVAKELAKQQKKVTLKIYKLDRLSRKMFTLANIIDDLNTHHIKLISIQENIETDSLTGRLLCIVLGYVAEIELDNIRLRTKEGLKKARENGVVLGKPALPASKQQEIIKLYQLNSIPVKDIAKRLKVSESSVYKVAKQQGISRRERQNSSF